MKGLLELNTWLPTWPGALPVFCHQSGLIPALTTLCASLTSPQDNETKQVNRCDRNLPQFQHNSLEEVPHVKTGILVKFIYIRRLSWLITDDINGSNCGDHPSECKHVTCLLPSSGRERNGWEKLQAKWDGKLETDGTLHVKLLKPILFTL